MVTCFATSNSSESWLIDSGCTNHMTYDEDIFKELDSSVESKVRIGNGEFQAVKAIEGCSGTKTITEVLYYLKLIKIW